MSGTSDVEDLFDAVIYADLFDCAVTLDEMWRYSRVRVARQTLLQRIDELLVSRIVREKSGYYFLAGREHLAEQRAGRRERAQQLRRRAQRVARWLQHMPFVRGVLLTGSVATDDAAPEADVDLLLIIADGRLALAFAQFGTLSRILSRRLFCPNYYLSESHLSLRRRDLYVARELAQSQALAGKAIDLQEANPWITDLLPNASPRVALVKPLPAGRFVQRLLELPLRGRLGAWLERRARVLALTRLAVHHRINNQPVPRQIQERFEAGVELRFHSSPMLDELAERYQKRRCEVAEAFRRPGSFPLANEADS